MLISSIVVEMSKGSLISDLLNVTCLYFLISSSIYCSLCALIWVSFHLLCKVLGRHLVDTFSLEVHVHFFWEVVFNYFFDNFLPLTPLFSLEHVFFIYWTLNWCSNFLTCFVLLSISVFLLYFVGNFLNFMFPHIYWVSWFLFFKDDLFYFTRFMCLLVCYFNVF